MAEDSSLNKLLNDILCITHSEEHVGIVSFVIEMGCIFFSMDHTEDVAMGIFFCQKHNDVV